MVREKHQRHKYLLSRKDAVHDDEAELVEEEANALRVAQGEALGEALGVLGDLEVWELQRFEELVAFNF